MSEIRSSKLSKWPSSASAKLSASFLASLASLASISNFSSLLSPHLPCSLAQLRHYQHQAPASQPSCGDVPSPPHAHPHPPKKTSTASILPQYTFCVSSLSPSNVVHLASYPQASSSILLRNKLFASSTLAFSSSSCRPRVAFLNFPTCKMSDHCSKLNEEGGRTDFSAIDEILF